MAARAITVSETDLLAARKQAARELSFQDLSRTSPQVQEVLLDVASGYIAATRAGISASESLEASIGLFAPGEGPAQPIRSLEELISSVARRPEHASEVIGGAYAFLSSDNPPFTLRLGDKSYRRSLPEKPLIVGLEKEKYAVVKCVNHLFSYRPEQGFNPLQDHLTQGVLLHGPPGTGKTSLCKYAVSVSRELSLEKGIPFRFETFKASDYSKWVGESAKALRRKLLSISDPAGIGVLVIDDADTIMDSRDDDSASSGGIQVTGEMMTFMSGLESNYVGNYVIFGTTNVPKALDSALGRRFEKRIFVPGYSKRSEYEALVNAILPWANDDVRAFVTDHSFTGSYSPAEVTTTCKFLGGERFDIMTAKQLEDPLSHAKHLGLPEVQSLLKNYSASYKDVM